MDVLTTNAFPEPEIRQIPSKKLVGIWKTMNLAENKTPELWKSFMPRRAEIKNNVNSFLFSLQVYPIPDFSTFTPHTLFTKWAAVEVPDFSNVPEGMETLTLTSGLYAVSLYKRTPVQFAVFFQKMLLHLAQQGYKVDNSRPHFELLGDKYKNNDPDSEEEIWVPVQ